MWVTKPSLLTWDTEQKGFTFVTSTGTPPGHSTPGSHTARDCQDGSGDLHPGPRQAGIPGPQALPRGKTRRALQAAGAMDRLHTVNSFTLMEIPNAVWPRERIWSPFKGPSSEFPTLAFSYHLSLPFLWVDLCRAAGLEDGVGVKREGALPEQYIPYITQVMVL